MSNTCYVEAFLLSWAWKDEEQNNQKIKETNTKFKKVNFLPIENFLNFKESGQIPNFLTKK